MKAALMKLWAIGETAPVIDPPPAAPPEAPPQAPAQSPGWVAQLDNDLKGLPDFTGLASDYTLSKFAREHLTTKGKLVELDGRVSKMIPRLPEKPTPDDLKAYRGAMGIPETPDKYGLKRVEWPAKLGSYPEQVETAFKQFAHEKHMSPDQAQATYNWYMGNIVRAGADIEQVAAQRKLQAVEELKKAWGDDYVANSEGATRAFWFYATPEDMKYFETSGLADNPKLIKMFHRIYLHTASDKLVRDAKPPLATEVHPKDAYGNTRLSYPTMEIKK